MLSAVFARPWTRYFSSWIAIRILILMALVLSLVSIGISSTQASSSAGDFQTFCSLATPPINFDSDVCNSMPYMALLPFRFTFQIGGVAFSNAAYCGWPQSFTVFRVVLAIIQAIFYTLLLVPRFKHYSIAFSPPLQFVTTFLWWAALVLDTQSLSVATDACKSYFGRGTIFYNYQKLGKFTMTCDLTLYGATNAIDFFMFLLTFIVFRAWSQCTNKYGIVTDAQSESGAKKEAVSPPSSATASETSTDKDKRVSSSGAWWRASENTRLSELYPRALSFPTAASGRETAASAAAAASFSKESAASSNPSLEGSGGKSGGTLSWFMRWWLEVGRYLERLVTSENSSDEAVMQTAGKGSSSSSSLSESSSAVRGSNGDSSGRSTMIPSGNAQRLAVGGTVAANPLQLLNKSTLGAVQSGYSVKSAGTDTGPEKPTKPLRPPRSEEHALESNESNNPFAEPQPSEDVAGIMVAKDEQALPPEPASPPPPLPFLHQLRESARV